MQKATRALVTCALLAVIQSPSHARIDFQDVEKFASKEAQKFALKAFGAPWPIETRTVVGDVRGVLPDREPEKALTVDVMAIREIGDRSGGAEVDVEVSCPIVLKADDRGKKLDAEGTLTLKISLVVSAQPLTNTLRQGSIKSVAITRSTLVMTQPPPAMDAQQRLETAGLIDFAIRRARIATKE